MGDIVITRNWVLTFCMLFIWIHAAVAGVFLPKGEHAVYPLYVVKLFSSWNSLKISLSKSILLFNESGNTMGFMLQRHTWCILVQKAMEI